MSRDKSVDIAKGIGIFLVVWGHAFDACPIQVEISLFHMPLFFFLAGCFLKQERLSTTVYKRIRTLMVPFLFFYAVAVAVKLGREFVSHLVFDTVLSFKYSLSNVNYVLWFIPALFWSLVICNRLIAKARYGGSC